jgi:hypothetical protein
MRVSILNGVDFVSNFYEYPEERQIEKWECERSELLSKLNKLDSITRSEKKRLVRLVRQERGPRNDTDAAIKFMKDFLPAPYGGIADGLWSVYRHGHTHLFVPKAIIGAGEVIQFGVAWTYLDTPSRTGISVKHVEDFINAGWEFARRKSQHLALCSNVFILNPHFFYVDFVNAATQFEGRLRNPKEARFREAFSRGYDQWINEIQITGDYANQLVKKIRRVAIPMSGQVI